MYLKLSLNIFSKKTPASNQEVEILPYAAHSLETNLFLNSSCLLLIFIKIGMGWILNMRLK